MLDNHRIPHAEVLERPFVAIPLAEIAPDYRHPETGQTLQNIAWKFQVSKADMRLRPDLAPVVNKWMVYRRNINESPEFRITGRGFSINPQR